MDDAKIKEGIFVGPEIKQLFHDTTLKSKLNVFVKVKQDDFEKVCKKCFLSRKISKSSKYCREIALIF